MKGASRLPRTVSARAGPESAENFAGPSHPIPWLNANKANGLKPGTPPDEDIPSHPATSSSHCHASPEQDRLTQGLATAPAEGRGVPHAFRVSRDAGGNKRYELDVLDLPDRKDVWHQALNRYDGGILKAYLVPPSLAGIEDLAAAGARILDGMLREFIQDLATFAANNLTELVGIVHAMNHDEVLAYEVPAAVRKLYLEVLRLIGAAKREQAPADWVDIPALLDQLGVPLRTTPAQAKDATDGGLPGRPPDMTGQRQERREDARAEGEETEEEPLLPWSPA
jgi:hypothetical protein